MDVRLPAEYQEVEYLKSTGTQYIDLGLNSPMVNGCFSVKTMIDYDTPGNTQLLGCNTDNSNKLPKVSIEAGGFNLRQNSNLGCGSCQKDSVFVLRIDRDRNIYVNDVKRGTLGNVVSYTGTSYYLFCAIPNSTYGAKARIYFFNIWDDEKQFVDLVPCYRKADDKPGMYDLVSGTFFINQGTGEFVVGPDVIDSISPWLVARRRLLMRKPLDTSPKIIAYDKRYVQGGSLQSSDGDCATEIYHYPVGTAMQNLYSYGANYYTLVYKNNGTTYMDWWAMATYNAPGKWGVLNKGSDGVGITLRSDMLDVCYAYIVETGEILFAGKESIYYGHKNISEIT